MGPDQLGDPTPCTEYDVRALLGHMVTVLHRVAAVGPGDDPFAVPRDPGGADDSWTEAWPPPPSTWTPPGPTTRCWPAHAPAVGRGPGAQILARYLNEITVHTWDLATAIGRRPA